MAERWLKHFGWGREGEGLTAEEEAFALDRYRRLFAVDRFDERSPPALSEIALRPPRIAPPPALAPHCSSEHYDRVAHTYGKSFSDYVRGLAGQYDNPPDVVAYPRNETVASSRRSRAPRAGRRSRSICAIWTASSKSTAPRAPPASRPESLAPRSRRSSSPMP
jgi:hypothetical protein